MEALAVPSYFYSMQPDQVCALWHRVSADGITFKIAPEFMLAADAEIALANAPHSYSADGQRFAPWPPGYTNVT